MAGKNQKLTGPLGNQSTEEIKFLLRGFPDTAISGALALRHTFNITELQDCLHGILKFYLPPGAQTSGTIETGSIRIKEDLGLDSLSIAESMFKIEEVFGIQIDFREISEIVTISDASHLLTQKLAASEIAAE